MSDIRMIRMSCSSFRRITTPCRSSFGIYPLYIRGHGPAIHGHSPPATPGP